MAEEFKISRLRYTWAGVWQTAKFYNRDAVISHEGKTYVCIDPHTSSNFNNDLNFVTPGNEQKPRWQLMVDGKVWKQEWISNAEYYPGNIVKFKGVVYFATVYHISTSTFDISKWSTYASLVNWNVSWDTNFVYGVGDVVRYGGIVYRCIQGHVSAATVNLGLEADQSKWEIVNAGIEYKGDWSAASAKYKLNDVVKNGADLWKATEGHTSASTFDLDKWEIWIPGVDFGSTWLDSAVYQPGDTVIYGGYSYISKTANNVNNIPSTSNTNWEILTLGYDFIGDWSSTASYKVGDVVIIGGNLFSAILDNTNQSPTNSSTTNVFESLAGNIMTLQSTAGIVPGSLITGPGFNNGQSVIEVIDNADIVISGGPSITVPNGTLLRFSGINYTYWKLLAPGIRWRYFWTNQSGQQGILGNNYLVGDLVVWQNVTYRCITAHNTNSGLRPDLDTDNLYWIIYLPHDPRNAGEIFGDMIVFDADVNRATALSIGNQDEILRKTNNFPTWRHINQIEKVYYVAENGVDSPDYGFSFDRPYRSIKYACERVAQGEFFTNAGYLLDENKDFLANEVYEWMIYQKTNNIAPFTTSSVFDEYSSKRDVRYVIDAIIYDIGRAGNSQTVAATLAYFSQENNDTFINQATTDAMPYIIASLNYLNTLIPLIIRNQFPAQNYQTLNGVTVGIEEQVIDGTKDYEDGADEEIAKLFEGILLDALTNNTKRRVPAPNQKLTSTINIKTGTYFEELPIVVPANTALNGDELRGVVVRPANAFYSDTRAINVLTNKFILSSVHGIEVGMPVQFVAERAFGGVVPSQTYYVKDVDEEGISVSVTPEGGEITLVTGIGQMMVYGGGALSDMFYVHNGSGIRNMTVSGLAGGLTQPNQYLTRRPTGGAYVSLDPGRGPNDTRAWIYRKSPYIQNVTTFGTGCVGCKIDGDLHNGGNRSIVSNDFTQIISDGIGVWCKGENALTELVSVFSYYCYAGYFAEDGGKIRATNGNSSYGTFGVIAEGFVANEVPITGEVFNKSQQIQAEVQSSFGTSAQLIKMQYANAGGNYYSETTNLIRHSNLFVNGGLWTNDGNVTLLQNSVAPNGQSIAWSFNGTTSNTDTAYLSQNITILPTGKTYLSVSGTNITGSGIGATFNIEVRSTGYVVTVASGGSGYVIGNQILVTGINLGGVSGVNDCIIQVSGLSGSSVTAVTSSGTVPSGSTTFYLLSLHVKKGTADSVSLQATFSGSNTKVSFITYDFATDTVTAGNASGGNTPTSFGRAVLNDGWKRIWFVASDADGLNNTLQYRIYPRGRTGNTGASLIYGAQTSVGTSLTFYLDTQDTRYRAHADFNIVGSGINAVAIGDELRSGAVFQTRVTTDPTNDLTGGRGYLITTNNAQGGNDRSITIAGSDVNTLATVVGMRLFINSGTGAGQYGYISDLNEITKVVKVLKESFDPLTVISTTFGSNLFTLSGGQTTDTLYTNMPVQFIPTYYSTIVTSSSTESVTITQTIGGQVNTIVIDSTKRLFVNMPITFTGTTFGGVTTDFTYYVKEIINENEFTISTTVSGVVWDLNSETGSMTLRYPASNGYLTATSTSDMLINRPIVFTGNVFGGISANTEYYINEVVDGTTFTISQFLRTITISSTNGSGVITANETINLVPLNAIRFSGVGFGGLTPDTTYYIERVINPTTFTVTGAIIEAEASETATTTNLITVNSTSGFTVNAPVVFVGNTVGGLLAEQTYFILAINDSTTFTVSSSVGGSAVSLNSAFGKFKVRTSAGTLVTSAGTGSMTGRTTSPKVITTRSSGSMTATFRTSLYGNVVQGTEYYVRTINSNSFTVSETVGGANFTLATDGGSMRVAASGWDHINPGTPPISLLDSSSIYYIEPRLEYSKPPFAQEAVVQATVLAPGSAYTSIANGNGFFIAFADGNSTASRTVDGSIWTSLALPVTRSWTDIAYGNNYWVAISSGGGGANSTALYSSSNGNGWIETDLPGNTTWSKIVYGNGVFVAIAEQTNTGRSTNFGGTWSPGGNLPAGSTFRTLAYGAGRFVTIATGGAGVGAVSSSDGTIWTPTTLPRADNFTGLAFGNGRFVGVSSTGGKSIYSFDGVTWYESNLSITADRICYGQGIFLALKSGNTTGWISEDGINWIKQTVENTSYGAIAFGFTTSVTPGRGTGTGTFITVGGTEFSTRIYAGATAKGRANVISATIPDITMWEPGSNYLTSPTLTITDPNFTFPATTTRRIGNGVLGNPTFFNRGEGYSSNSTVVTINGDGFADEYQLGFKLIVKDLTKLPSPGDNLQINGNSIVYKVTSATAVFGTTAPNLEANVFISPELTVANSPDDGTPITIRTKYSQVRLTNHDFLSIGYGDERETNYPNLPTDTVLSPQDQTVETNNGRVFYTSTDQDGNFKVGNLFAVEQATGIVTISATQFDLGGLDRLSIGGIAVGGNSVVIRQFSTDPTFVANSNEIVPTQRAIKAYLTSRLSQGGSNTFTGELTAGTIKMGGPDKITSTVPEGIIGHQIKIPVKADISGDQAAWAGDGLAMYYFIKGFWRR